MQRALLPVEDSVRNQFDHLSTRVKTTEIKIDQISKSIHQDITATFNARIEQLEGKLNASIEQKTSASDLKQHRESLDSSVDLLNKKVDSSFSALNQKISNLEIKLTKQNAAAKTEMLQVIDTDLKRLKKELTIRIDALDHSLRQSIEKQVKLEKELGQMKGTILSFAPL